ncbi:MAG: glycosyltransferase [Acidobacteria bacterium]|nr:glycosyltransferase [Acidobacteriota bacterium]
MRITIVVPAFNEEAYLTPTLESIRAAADEARASSGVDVDVIVVDNASADGTAALARDLGATVVHEPVQGISRARNAGARRAAGDVLVFFDADVVVPRAVLAAICAAMRDPTCVGGGVDVDYRPRRSFVRLYLRLWWFLARAVGMVQGAAQFCRQDAFAEVGGYDESVWMGEDVEFHWGLRKLAGRTGRNVRFLREPRVTPSCRRFDKWPVWKILVWTNPVVIGLFRRRKAVWRGWYSSAVR